VRIAKKSPSSVVKAPKFYEGSKRNVFCRKKKRAFSRVLSTEAEEEGGKCCPELAIGGQLLNLAWPSKKWSILEKKKQGSIPSRRRRRHPGVRQKRTGGGVGVGLGGGGGGGWGGGGGFCGGGGGKNTTPQPEQSTYLFFRKDEGPPQIEETLDPSTRPEILLCHESAEGPHESEES